MHFNPSFDKPYASYLYDLVKEFVYSGTGYKIKSSNEVWALASYIGERVDLRLP